MIANISIVLMWIVAQSYGRLSRFFFQGDHLEHDEIQRHFFTPGLNLAKLMSDMSAIAEQCFTARPVVAIRRLIVCLWLCFLGAALFYSLKYSGLELLIRFVSRGLTVEIDQGEKVYLLQHAPAAYYDLSRASGRQMFIGDSLASLLVVILTILAFLSLTSALSIQNTLALIRRLRSTKPFAAMSRMVVAFFASLLLDLIFVILFLLAIVLGGKTIGLTLEEEFKASIDGKWLEYGVSLASGRETRTPTGFALLYGVRDVNFDELTHDSTPPPAWLRWILPSTILSDDALVLCNRPGTGPHCEDRLRALFLRRNAAVDNSGMYVAALHVIFDPARVLACGHNPWSTMPMGQGASDGLRLILPLFAALTIVYLAKLLLIPTLIVITICNSALVRLGAYAAISSESGLSMTMTHGAALLAAPPIVAIALLTAFARWSC